MPRGRPKKASNEELIKFSLRLDKELMEQLKIYSESRNITKAKALRNAISLYIGYDPKNNK